MFQNNCCNPTHNFTPPPTQLRFNCQKLAPHAIIFLIVFFSCTGEADGFITLLGGAAGRLFLCIPRPRVGRRAPRDITQIDQRLPPPLAASDALTLAPIGRLSKRALRQA
jgi:hypothetical protein